MKKEELPPQEEMELTFVLMLVLFLIFVLLMPLGYLLVDIIKFLQENA